MPYIIPYLGYIAEAATVVSAGIGVYSAVDQAQTAKETAKYNNEAANAEARNKDALAAESIRRQREQNRRRVADIRNNLASNGTLSSEGTPLAIIGEASSNLELGVQDAARQAAAQSSALRAQGQMGLWEGDQAARADITKGIASGISGIGTAAEYGYNDYKLGMFKTKPPSNNTP